MQKYEGAWKDLEGCGEDLEGYGILKDMKRFGRMVKAVEGKGKDRVLWEGCGRVLQDVEGWFGYFVGFVKTGLRYLAGFV